MNIEQFCLDIATEQSKQIDEFAMKIFAVPRWVCLNQLALLLWVKMNRLEIFIKDEVVEFYKQNKLVGVLKMTYGR